MSHNAALLFEASMIGWLLLVVAASVLQVRGWFSPYQTLRVITTPLLFGVAACGVLYFPLLEVLAPLLAWFTCVVALIVFGTYFIDAWLTRRREKQNKAKQDEAESEAYVWPPASILTPNEGHVPQHITLPLRDAYAFRTRICIRDEIDKSSDEQLALACQKIIEQDSPSPVTVEINSPGGHTRYGWSMAGRIRTLAKHTDVIVVVVGECYSAANYVLLAVPVDRRFAMPEGTLMFHRAEMTNDDGMIDRDRLTAKGLQALDMHDSRIATFIAQGTAVAAESIRSVMRRGVDVYMTVQQALELGIISGIIDE